ncbi:carboxymethylenebutenolidase [Rhodococcus sp. 27YEA15]|uniref:dienelactone hydrolase family protein n=1 Tax=Rhodococcus sp. 27YEA15 TaxID=3156259 RepID=UPI003C7DCE8F
MSEISRDVAYSRTEDGAITTSVPLTVVDPDGPRRGAIIVLHEERQFTEPLLALMHALAAEGWLALAPHLFHRHPEGGAGEVFGDDLFVDVDAALDWLAWREVPADTVGVLGFDAAGTATMLVASNRRVGAAVSVAARGIDEALTADSRSLLDVAPALQAPWLGLYGDNDPQTSPDAVNRLRDAVGRAEVAALVVSYEGLGHRADATPEKIYENGLESEIVDAKTRIFDWFGSHLR